MGGDATSMDTWYGMGITVAPNFAEVTTPTREDFSLSHPNNTDKKITQTELFHGPSILVKKMAFQRYHG